MIQRYVASGVAAAAALVLFGCGSTPTVTRVVDGRVLEGHFVVPDAYAAFLRGAIAEEQGELRVALAAYEETVGLDEADPEVWTRICALRCRLAPGDARARWAADRALALDTEYAPAWAARARCELGRPQDRVDLARDALRAADADPTKVDYQVFLAHVEAMRNRAPEVARQRLVALTLAHGTSPAAWMALASWSRSHGDGLASARASGRVAQLAPTRREELAREVLALAGDGELDAARFLAGALVDAGRFTDQSTGLFRSPASNALVARLAIDEAIGREDLTVLGLRQTATHLGVDQVAGRALLLGKPWLVPALVSPTIKADPRASGARMVLAVAAAQSGDTTLLARALATAAAVEAPIPAEVWLPFVTLLAARTSAVEARRLLDALPRERVVAGDELVVKEAVDAAARKVIDEEALSLDGKVELAVREGAAFTLPLEAVDARHRLLALSSAPSDAALQLLAHLASTADRDRVVAVAAARIRMHHAHESDWRDAISAERLAAIAPADALVVTTALAVAVQRREEAVARRLRTRLIAVALTPHERALAAAE